jgi:hypothetical protein
MSVTARSKTRDNKALHNTVLILWYARNYTLLLRIVAASLRALGFYCARAGLLLVPKPYWSLLISTRQKQRRTGKINSMTKKRENIELRA